MVRMVFLVMHRSGKSILPVLARMGKVVEMSVGTFGWNQMVMYLVTPADIRPGGKNSISKKSFILSSSGSSLNWLNVRETFVTSTTCLYFLPTSKSAKVMMLGFARKASPLNSLPQQRCTVQMFCFCLSRAAARYCSSSFVNLGTQSLSLSGSSRDNLDPGSVETSIPCGLGGSKSSSGVFHVSILLFACATASFTFASSSGLAEPSPKA
mmetsp:Transcript_45133/g.107348  ORF Transcript_45133/g.107348 Transcript_45133/m.107348 type:complete len:210 (-) Transcript_45133:1466-2095(-)